MGQGLRWFAPSQSGRTQTGMRVRVWQCAALPLKHFTHTAAPRTASHPHPHVRYRRVVRLRLHPRLPARLPARPAPRPRPPGRRHLVLVIESLLSSTRNGYTPLHFFMNYIHVNTVPHTPAPPWSRPWPQSAPAPPHTAPSPCGTATAAGATSRPEPQCTWGEAGGGGGGGGGGCRADGGNNAFCTTTR